jgi:hypothetical protein
MDEARWQQHLYRTHPQAEISLWARQLTYFRFCRASGSPLTDDGDELKVALKIDSEEDLVETCSRLGVPLRRISVDALKPVPGVSYSAEEYAKFDFSIPGFPTIAQPGWTTLLRGKVYVWVGPNRLEISVTNEDSQYEVSAAAVDVASKIEELLRPLAEKLIEPPLDNRSCICPKLYPELWVD